MNRADRRAIKFGKAFSEKRSDYSMLAYNNPFVGIDSEMYWAFIEEGSNTCGWSSYQMINWIDSEICPSRY